MADYVATYSRRDQISRRTGSRYAEDDIEIIQRNIDNKINSAIRARVGEFDKNNYRIILPLSGSTESIDDYNKTYQIPMVDELRAIADSLVIAHLEHDFSENADRLERAENELEMHLSEHYGNLSADPIDFTSDFLRATKLISTDGKYFKITNDNKVLNIEQTIPETNIVR